MAYHIYHTRGIILGSVPVGESNRFYKIFTEELGLVGATAQSVREGKSKLRYSLQDLSFVSVDLVRGKEVWRITSAGEWRAFLAPQSALRGVVAEIKKDAVQLKLFARACSLVSRLLQGEGREPELFADLVGVADFINLGVSFPSTLGNETPKLLASLEALIAMRILVYLGYLDPAEYEGFLEPGAYSQKLLEKFEIIRAKSLPKINEALKVSHL